MSNVSCDSVSTFSVGGESFNIELCSIDNIENEHTENQATENNDLILDGSNRIYNFQPLSTTSKSEFVQSTIQNYLSCIKGRIISNYYEKFKKIGSKQNDLANLIIEKELDSQIFNRIKITTERFIDLAKAIHQLFPSERENVYYVPYSNKTHSLSTGKLWTAYIKIKKKINAVAQNINEKTTILDKETISCLELLENAITNNENWCLIEQAWGKTFQTRFRIIKEGKREKVISEYFKRFPILQASKGYELFEKDFDLLYPNKSNCMAHNWPVLNKFLLTKLETEKNCKSLLTTIIDCDETIKGFYILPYLIKNNFGKKRCNRNSIKYSKIEISDGFILKILDLFEFEAKKKEINKKHIYLTGSLQPNPLFIGEGSNITGYISFGSALYKIGNPIKTIDICFKLYQASHSCYPILAEAVWLFIQKAVYTINTEWDHNFISVNNLVGECEEYIKALP